MDQSKIGITIIDENKEKTIDVLFGFTSLAKDSTLIENYDFIQYKLNDAFENWSQMEKRCHFVYKGAKQEVLDDRYGLETIQRDNYVFQGPIHSQHIPGYMNSCDTKFDVVMFTECNSLIEIFFDSKAVRSLFDEDVKTLFKRIKDFYNGFNPEGMFVILYYNEDENTTSFANMDVFYGYSCLWSLDVYLFILRVFGKLFKKIEPGIYEREKTDNVDQLILNTYHSVVEELFNIGVDKLEKKEELIETIDKTYFGGNLIKSNKYSLERPILSNISNLVDETLKMSE